MDFKNKKVVVVGAGISGKSSALILRRLGATVTLNDARSEQQLKEVKSEMEELGIKTIFGRQDEGVFQGIDMVLLSPAVPYYQPIFSKLVQKNIPVISEIELADYLAEAPILAVTGTNGKTTTTTLLGELLASQYHPVGVGGNIGIPLAEEALRTPRTGRLVAEISSYQLESTKHFHPHIAIVLNVTPDHLARHGSMEVYQATKEKIFAEQNQHDFLLLNNDDERVHSMEDRAPSKVVFFSTKQILKEGAWID